jgi:hypothetical protein
VPIRISEAEFSDMVRGVRSRDRVLRHGTGGQVKIRREQPTQGRKGRKLILIKFNTIRNEAIKGKPVITFTEISFSTALKDLRRLNLVMRSMVRLHCMAHVDLTVEMNKNKNTRLRSGLFICHGDGSIRVCLLLLLK